MLKKMNPLTERKLLSAMLIEEHYNLNPTATLQEMVEISGFSKSRLYTYRAEQQWKLLTPRVRAYLEKLRRESMTNDKQIEQFKETCELIIAGALGAAGKFDSSRECKLIADLIAKTALPEYEAHAWRDISEAPRDGTELLACGDYGYELIRWGKTEWVSTGIGDSAFPTHFQLIQPPKGE